MSPDFWTGALVGFCSLPVGAALIYLIRNIDKNPEAW